MKAFFTIFAKILYACFCLILTLFVAYFMFMVPIFSNFDFQIVSFILWSLLLIAGFWSLLFVKIKVPMKVLTFLLLLIALFGYFKIALFLPSVQKAIDIDMCMDSGTCAEGLKTGIDGNVVEINKENCLKYNKIWNEERKWCQVR